jgi:hypothetical protein
MIGMLACLVIGYLLATLVAHKGGPTDFPDNLASAAMLIADGLVIYGTFGA